MVKLILLDVVVSILDIFFLAGLLYVIHFYTMPDHSLPFTWLPAPVFNKYPLLLILIFFLLFSFKNLFGFFVYSWQSRFIYGLASRLSKKNIINYLDGSYNDYVSIDSSVQTRTISQQPIEFCYYIVGGFQQIISQSTLIFIAICAILVFNPVLFLVLLGILAPPVILTGLLLRKKLNSVRKNAKTTGKKTIQHLHEAISAYIESNVFQRKDFFVHRYHRLQEQFNNFLSDQRLVQNLPSRLIEVFAIFGLLVIILISQYTTPTSSFQLITLGAFMAAAYKIIPGIVKILNTAGQMKTYEFTVDDLLKQKSVPAKGKMEARNSLTNFEFVNVFFSYKDRPVLTNFSFSMSKGDFAGLSGFSGAGKTTIVNLLLGFLEPDRGYIIINNTAMMAPDRQQQWPSVSYVKQQAFFIHDSVHKNITLEEDYDSERLKEVMAVTGVDMFLDQYADGINTIITENGKNISGGQRQRIVIARTLYKNADLVILDEPFNELDKESERSFLHYFKSLSESGKMILLITHNKECFSYCNKTISLDEQ